MAKAKPIDRVEFTRRKLLSGQELPRSIDEMHYMEICPECGAELIHEAGCLRCFCGWSKC